MINPRAHKLENEKCAAMLNSQFCDHYNQFLINIIEKERLSDEDHLVFATYLLIQDRIEESMNMFKKVNPKNFSDKYKNPMVIQYDYMSAYFDILVGYDAGFKVARKVSKEYENYPVIHWRMLFIEILDQLKEFDGKEDQDSDIDLEDIDKKKENLKKSKKLEPTLDFNITEKECFVDFTNVESVTVKYYIVNPEILFTRAPFLIQNTSDFSYVKPIFQEVKEFPPKSKTFTFPLKKEYLNNNLLVELDCGSKKVFQTYFSCSLKVTLIENFAELKVTDEKGVPVPQVYVKAFSRTNYGDVRFFKDGYTDMRGKFEYGYTNTENLYDIDKLSILVMSDKLGSVIKEVKLPGAVAKDADMGFLNARQAQKYAMWDKKNVKGKKKGKGKKKK